MSQADCPFCLANGLLSDAPVNETAHFYTLLSIDPSLPHAAMVIPRRHSSTPFEMNAAEWTDLPNALAAARTLLEPLGPQGFNIGWNVGATAGQHVFHTHMHVIARFAGDPLAGKGIRPAFKMPKERGQA